MNESDGRLRQQKKKIFAQQVSKSRQNNTSRHSLTNMLNTGSQLITPRNGQDLSMKMDELTIKNNQLKLLLKQQRQRYDSLFEQYEDLMEKNSLIEKEYINLKYQHNKQTKENKKQISEKIKEDVNQYIEEFYHGLKEDNIGDVLKGKIQKLMEQLKGLSSNVASLKLKKHHNKRNSDHQIQSIRTDRSTISDRHGIEDVQFLEPEPIAIIHPEELQKEHTLLKEQQSVTSPRQPQKEMFEDEYYGTLEDFVQFEEKVTMRRNYELMRRNNRNSGDVRRKKIFHSMGQSNCL